MVPSKAGSDEDKAREEVGSDIDVRKTRRRIEDTLRKSNLPTVIRVAELLGVEVVRISPKAEIAMADVHEKLSTVWSRLVKRDEKELSEILANSLNKILHTLPPRFKVYFIASGDNQRWSRVSRDFLTREAAEKHKNTYLPWHIIKVFRFNVIQMRLTIRGIETQIQQYKATPLEPDEEEKLKELKQTLYTSVEEPT